MTSQSGSRRPIVVPRIAPANEMLVDAGQFLREVWVSGTIDTASMIVRRGNDSSTWNLMAGAWNKLRDGWFALCRSTGADEVMVVHAAPTAEQRLRSVELLPGTV